MSKTIMSMEECTRQAMKVLANHLVVMAKVNRDYTDAYPFPEPTMMQRFKRSIRFYPIKRYLGDLWDVICGKEQYE